MQHYGFVLLPGFGLGALAGAVDALTAANAVLGEPVYEAHLLSIDSARVDAAGGVAVATDTLANVGPLDAVFIVSDTPFSDHEAQAAPLLAWLRARAVGAMVFGGIGTGAAWLAEAGLLSGHRATVHWPHIALMAERHVDVVVSQQVYEIDRARLSCAAHHASQDMMIAWLGQRHGERVAQELVPALGLERARGREERQRVPIAHRLGGGSAKLAEAVSLMEANLGEPLPTEDIARLVGVSRRQLERLFKQHLDALPSRWYLELRLERARRMLRQTSHSILQIGLSCGFASGPHFSNAYRARFGHTPRDERSQRAAAWRQTSVPGPASPAQEDA